MSKESCDELVYLLGGIIDLPLDKFKQELVDQHVNVGQISNMILWLESSYAQCRVSKDAIIERIISGTLKRDAQVDKTLNGLYAEMAKIELKVVHLKRRRKELSVGKTTD